MKIHVSRCHPEALAEGSRVTTGFFTSFRMTSRGSSAVEFVLVLPWLVAILAGVVTVVLWVFEANIVYLKAFGMARKAIVYAADEGKFSKEVFGLKRPFVAQAPFQKTLEGIDLDLNAWDKMDNPIGFCGSGGGYHLCAR